MNFTISGNIVDIHNREIFPGIVTIEDNKIKKIERNNGHV